MHEVRPVRSLRVTVVGNSNSIMRGAYSHILAGAQGIEVTNRSLGATTNVVLLHALTDPALAQADLVIVETAVVDQIAGKSGTYTPAQSREALELFIADLRGRSAARLIFLVLPPRVALLERQDAWVEQLYRDVAERNGIAVLDGYALLRELIGPILASKGSEEAERAAALLGAVALPRHHNAEIAWHRLHDTKHAGNTLGRLAFNDDLHLSRRLHRLCGEILLDVLREDLHAPAREREADAPPCVRLAQPATVPARIDRRSALIGRTLIALGAGDVATFACPPGWHAAGLLVNAGVSCGRLTLHAGERSETLDLTPQHRNEWIAVVHPLAGRVGGSTISVTLDDGAADVSGGTRAEIADLLLVRTEWRATAPLRAADSGQFRDLLDAPGARDRIGRAIADAQDFADLFDAHSSLRAASLRYVTEGPSDLAVARLLVLAGDWDALRAHLAGSPDSRALADLRRVIDGTATPEPDGEIWDALAAAAGRATAAGRLDEAERILAMAASRFPELTGPLHDLARLAERRHRWSDAERCWRSFLAIDARPWWAHAALSAALRQQNRIDDAAAVIAAALRLMPDEAGLAIEQARIADAGGETADAISHWSDAAARFPNVLEATLGHAGALARTGHETQAVALLAAAAERFPDNPNPWHDRARLAERQHDWTEAERCWRAFIARDPRIWWAHTGLAAALRELGRAEEADLVLADVQARLPDEPGPFVEHARVAERQRDWDAALARWEVVRTRFPDRWEGETGRAAALAATGRDEEARAALLAVTVRFPDEAHPWHDLARAEERRRDWPAAERCWRCFLLCNDRPEWAHVALARSLREQGRADEADAAVSQARTRFPSDFGVLEESARIAAMRADWAAVVARWEEIAAHFPDRAALATGEIHQARLRLLDREIELAQQAGADLSVLMRRRDDAEDSPERALMMAFESLGGLETGCEFGGVQRSFGAEPLSLLRWSGMATHTLVELLERRFERIGDPETTRVEFFTGDTRPDREYALVDATFGFWLHGHVHESQMSGEEFHSTACRRLQFLRRKLIDDLGSGEKIFLYKDSLRAPFPDEIERLCNALRTYGANRFLFVTRCDETNAAGTVRPLGGGLWLGFLDFSGELDDTRASCWLDLCRSAHRAIMAVRPEQSASDAWIAMAHDAEHRGEWPDAERCWRSLIADTPKAWWSQVALVRALLKQDRRVEAFATAEAALAGPLGAAPEWVADLLAVLGDRIDPSVRPLIERMQAILADACATPDPPAKALAGFANAALCLGDHDAFLARARTFFQAHPGRADARRLLHDAIEVTGAGDIPPGVVAEPVASLPQSDPDAAATVAALARLESLGGGGNRGGCELGFVQREYGLEPLGLLRWASIAPERLADMLERRLDGLGAPGTLELREQGHPDWQAFDRVYGIRMDHTHLDRATVSEAQATRLVETRMRFLARKLLEDLTAGEKLFAYAVTGTPLDGTFVSRMTKVFATYGFGQALLVGDVEQGAAVTVERAFPNVIVVSRPDLGRGAPLSAIMASWRDVLRAASLT